jgi:hypothetical protein
MKTASCNSRFYLPATMSNVTVGNNEIYPARQCYRPFFWNIQYDLRFVRMFGCFCGKLAYIWSRLILDRQRKRSADRPNVQFGTIAGNAAEVYIWGFRDGFNVEPQSIRITVFVASLRLAAMAPPASMLDLMRGSWKPLTVIGLSRCVHRKDRKRLQPGASFPLYPPMNGNHTFGYIYL